MADHRLEDRTERKRTREDSSEDERGFNRTARSEKWRERGRGKGRSRSGGAAAAAKGTAAADTVAATAITETTTQVTIAVREVATIRVTSILDTLEGERKATAAAMTAAAIAGDRTEVATIAGGNPTERPLPASKVCL